MLAALELTSLEERSDNSTCPAALTFFKVPEDVLRFGGTGDSAVVFFLLILLRAPPDFALDGTFFFGELLGGIRVGPSSDLDLIGVIGVFLLGVLVLGDSCRILDVLEVNFFGDVGVVAFLAADFFFMVDLPVVSS